ncbi:hypothetical protein D3C81_2266280 [compost metagenome]
MNQFFLIYYLIHIYFYFGGNREERDYIIADFDCNARSLLSAVSLDNDEWAQEQRTIRKPANSRYSDKSTDDF